MIHLVLVFAFNKSTTTTISCLITHHLTQHPHAVSKGLREDAPLVTIFITDGSRDNKERWIDAVEELQFSGATVFAVSRIVIDLSSRHSCSVQ